MNGKNAKLEQTPYGFKYGPLEVERTMSDDKIGVYFTLRTAKESIMIRSTPSGLLRVFQVQKVKKPKKA